MKRTVGPDLPALKVKLSAKVDAEAEAFRLNFITPGAGQAMTYQEKYAEAQALLDNPLIDEATIPLIMAEVGITAADKTGVANLVVQLRNQWKAISAKIEKARLTAKDVIEAATTISDAYAAAEVNWPALLAP